MKFQSTNILTGVIQRVSKKTNQPYTICNFLNEEGFTFSAMYKGSDDLSYLSQMDMVDVTFNLRTGQYMNLEVLSIHKS